MVNKRRTVKIAAWRDGIHTSLSFVLFAVFAVFSGEIKTLAPGRTLSSLCMFINL